jgi:hypothetical protein
MYLPIFNQKEEKKGLKYPVISINVLLLLIVYFF